MLVNEWVNRSQAIYLKAINDMSHDSDSYRSEAVNKHINFGMALQGRILPNKIYQSFSEELPE
jgi:hypothetical protein